ncbi:MAG: hypothetical protein RLY97_883 [Pseudomonadota bacterium]
MANHSGGALAGLTVIELAGIGPAPFAGMMLADHGARVIRIDAPARAGQLDINGSVDVLARGREHLALDLKSDAGHARMMELLRGADVLIEGFRPGVLERLGLGPDVLLAANPRLVIGRMTGWGQDGPKARLAGHDIDYIALSGALSTYGSAGGKPIMPTNAVGDFGGGGMMLAFGMLAAVLSARTTGMGQVVDCAMVDGAALVSAMTYGLFGNGLWQEQRGSNLLDGGAPHYNTYETADGRYIAVGALELPFYNALIARLGLADDADFAGQAEAADWPAMREKWAALFLTKTRDEWCALLEDSDACVAPVLGLSEAPLHPHNLARGTFMLRDGIIQPAPAPRFSATPAPVMAAPVLA